MNLTLYFLLAHFLSDYPLQTNWVAKAKQKGWLGLWVHTLTHLLTTALLLSAFWHEKKVWLGVVGVFLSHLLIDKLKIEKGFGDRLSLFSAYLIDQALHYSVIFLVATYFVGKVDAAYGTPISYAMDPLWVSYLIVLILSTYFYDISRWIYRGGAKKKPYSRDYKMMSRHAILVTILFAVGLYFA